MLVFWCYVYSGSNYSLAVWLTPLPDRNVVYSRRIKRLEATFILVYELNLVCLLHVQVFRWGFIEITDIFFCFNFYFNQFNYSITHYVYILLQCMISIHFKVMMTPKGLTKFGLLSSWNAAPSADHTNSVTQLWCDIVVMS